MDHPVDSQQLPEAARKVLAGPAPMKMMAARGMAPLPPVALVCALYAFAHDRADEKLREAAAKTLGNLPPAVLDGALGAPELPAAVLDDLASRLKERPDALARIVRHPAVLGDTLARVARTCDEATSELIAINEQKLLMYPEVIKALYFNEHTRMSTSDRIVELAARNGLTVDIPGFADIVAALKNQTPPEKTAEPLPSDAEFVEALKISAEVKVDEIEDGDDTEHGEPKVTSEKAEKVNKAISKMTITEKIRTAMLGNAAQRALLIRSPNRLVFNAVLDSPKLGEDEVVKYAASRQVGGDVLRRICSRKDFLRLYDVKLNLVFNPKTPVTESMKLLNQLRENDVKKVVGSKNVPTALRNMANGLLNKRK
jgi:hypothetical protein